MFKPNKNQILIGVAVLAILVTGVLVAVKSKSINVFSFFKITPYISADVISKKSVDYLNTSVLQKGQVATLVSFSEESGVVKMKVKIGENTYDSYATKDGKLLFPEAFIMTDQPADSIQPNQPSQVTPENVVKVAKTSLEAYVVSYCPYGLQMQRAMAQAIENAPSLEQYVKVRYIGAVSGDGKAITAMHGDKEAKQNLKEICIEREQKDKYWPYVSCKLKSEGAADSCLSSIGINTAKLNKCITDPSKGVAYAQEDFALQAKYSVQGSPTLILNGITISEDLFGGRSADGVKNMVCDSSTTKLDFCAKKLDTTPAATSFSLTYAGSNPSVAASNSADCAPATN